MLNTNGYPVPQYDDKICCAASVATVVRYVTDNYTITARNVCDKINHPYDGGGILKKRSALYAYNLYYSNLMYEQASFGQIQTNILDQKPMLLSTFSSDEGHAVTLMGYSTYGGVNQIVIHNSANQTLQTIEYRNSGTVYSYNGKIWTWKYTLSYH